MKHDVATEWRVPNGYIDIVDKTTWTFYEIEFHVSPKIRNRKLERYKLSGYNIIIVNCSKLPNDLNKIQKYLEQFIVPE